MNTLRKINIAIFISTLLLSIGIWLYWENVCAVTGCDSIIREYFMRPLLRGSLIWTIILATLLFFPTSFFKKWSLAVGIPGFIIMLISVLNTDPHSSSILSLDRGQAAWYTGVVIALITGLAILSHYAYSFWKTRTLPTPWYRLLILVLAGGIIYLFATL